MTIMLDPITYKKLILIKQMYGKATVLSNREHSTVDKIIALIIFDLAVETVLKTVINSLDASKNPPDSFQSLIEQIKTLLVDKQMKTIPNLRQIRHVHSLRNDAQHKTKYPNKSDLDACRIYVRDFLKIFVSNVYKTDFETITQTESISHEKIKQHLVDAEEHFKNGNYQKASECANVGLQTAISYAGKPYVGRPVDRLGKIVTERSNKIKGNDEITEVFQRIQDTVRYLALGLDYFDMVRFHKIAGFVSLFLGDNYKIDDLKENISEDEVEFVLLFAIDTIVQIENHVGNLEKPFGQRFWPYNDIRKSLHFSKT